MVLHNYYTFTHHANLVSESQSFLKISFRESSVMNRPFHVLVLGAETPIGQSVLTRLSTHFSVLKVAVPAARYAPGLPLPAYFLPMDRAILSDSLKQVRALIACSPEFSTPFYREAAAGANCSFVDISTSYSETVVESCFTKLNFDAKSMKAFQIASDLGFRGFWAIAHRRSRPPRPRPSGNIWLIEQGSVDFESGGARRSMPVALEFKRGFFAKLFWFFAMIVRFIWPRFRDVNNINSSSNWRFVGTTTEHEKFYEFECVGESMDTDLLRADLAVIKVCDALGVPRDESADWPAFEQLKLQFVRYQPISP
jgi:hypothetical protein